MANELAVNTSAGLQVIDSLSVNEFVLEIEGAPIKTVLRITSFFAFKLDVKTTTSLKLIQEPFKVVKMVERDANAPFNRWIRETTAAQADIVRPRRTLALVAIDDGVEIRRWTIKGAWISEVCYSEFNTGSADLVEETITIQYEGIEDSWPIASAD